MITLIQGGEIFAPEPLGPMDILLAGGAIEAVAEPRRIRVEGLEAQIIDAAGGSVDVAIGPDPVPPDPEVGLEDCIARFRDKGLPFNRMMVSSDSNGSLPVFDESGGLVRLTIATEADLFRKFRDILRGDPLPVETVVRLFSTNAADFYKLGKKGRIEPGRDADLIILDRDLELSDVLAKGRRMMAAGTLLAHGTFSAPGDIDGR